MRPEKLALRVVNQYRTRDIFAYLGLRYLFENVCSRRDIWARTVAKHLALNNDSPKYLKSYHFKDFHESGQVEHRFVFLPAPNEALVEAALLDECAKYKVFISPTSVFSYKLSQGEDSRGVYVPYFEGFRERHLAIAEACKGNKGATVLYTDIKSFYPNLNGSVVKSSWVAVCDSSSISLEWKNLGCNIIDGYSRVSAERGIGKGLLTGPMFSHLLANLVLREIDDEFMILFPGRYFRYVDDIVLIGDSTSVRSGRTILSERLSALGLELHSLDGGKEFSLSSEEWLAGEDDFGGNDMARWGGLVSDIKYILHAEQEGANMLNAALVGNDFRMPIPRYKNEVAQDPWKISLQQRIRKYKWLANFLRMINVPSVIEKARILREQYIVDLGALLSLGSNLQGYERKRVIPKIRFLSGRLLYLGTLQQLENISTDIFNYPELRMLSKVMMSIVKRDVTDILPLGVNAVQSAAQILKNSKLPVICSIQVWNDVNRQGLAVLRLNGIEVGGPVDDDLNRFSIFGGDKTLMGDGTNLFVRELSCLHGDLGASKHGDTLDTIFDWAESFPLDGINYSSASDY